jgi:hypothetical protein
MRAIFPVTDIGLADTAVGSRRGVLFVEDGRERPGWHVIVYDSRPGLTGVTGLELPFSARGEDGSLLTGWVKVGRGEAGVQFLEGAGRLSARRMWHTLPARERRRAQAAIPQGPSAICLETIEV